MRVFTNDVTKRRGRGEGVRDRSQERDLIFELPCCYNTRHDVQIGHGVMCSGVCI